jgi:hypothetical protein
MSATAVLEIVRTLLTVVNCLYRYSQTFELPPPPRLTNPVAVMAAFVTSLIDFFSLWAEGRVFAYLASKRGG